MLFCHTPFSHLLSPSPTATSSLTFLGKKMYYVNDISIILFIIVCLPLRETNVVLFSLYVRMSVRPCIHLSVCNAFLSEPYLPETFVQEIELFSIIRVPTELMQQKIKVQLEEIFKNVKFWWFLSNFSNFDSKITFYYTIAHASFCANSAAILCGILGSETFKQHWYPVCSLSLYIQEN